MHVTARRIFGCFFAVACSHGLLDMHSCSGGLSMAPSCLESETAGCKSSDDWRVSLAMALAVADTWS